MRGKLIVLEGLDGSGKSTLAQSLADRLSEDRTVVRYAEPGGTALSDDIRDLLKDPEAQINSRAEALLFAAARAQLSERIEEDLGRGDWVLLDRWIYSSVAYQGAGRGLGSDGIEQINRWASGGLEVDAWIYLRLSPDQAAGRRARRGQATDRIEAEDDRFFSVVASSYDEQAESDHRAIVLDGSQPPEELAEKAFTSLAEMLA